MAANNNPIYTRTADVQIAGAVIGPSANTATDGTGANVFLLFDADATEGGFVYKIVAKPVASPAATVMRIFLCTATGAFTPGTTNTAANSALLAEATLPLVTASNTTATTPIEIPINIPLPADYKLFATFGTSTGAAGNGYNPVTVGGKY